MEKAKLEELKYPIGKFEVPATISREQVADWIAVLEYFPNKLESLVKGLSPSQLDTPYRKGGWTIRQVVHHVADSHHNSYIRFKWGLTEQSPIIKPYFEKEWAELFDTRTAPIDLSINHLKAVHAKLVYLLKGLTDADLKRGFFHPDNKEITSLEENIGRYAWHGNHHYRHIKNALEKNNWI
ncbi:YfiT family bacillithiol transferase [uncultured Eudoraea sp.]|uniref:YfiT family bacillithiol transferase n=1 Tax=uncultured Eudoraea sp. TaxID=1035614 RepID=UPI002607E100|nr:bacillithiol transferase BstA [uncultured Eudoraea sp.]